MNFDTIFCLIKYIKNIISISRSYKIVDTVVFMLYFILSLWTGMHVSYL